MKSIIALLFAALLAGCALDGGTRPEAAKAVARPAWIDNPGDGVSASAGFHVRGRQAQEELAITRAREEYAKRYGVTISSEHLVQQTVADGRSATVSDKNIREEVKQQDVKAALRAKWTDPDTGVLWVWVTPSKE
ncbi:MAG: hypothetical protein HZB71_04200 [Betaproteobacteria bacterium]|nr:hypothetical protein [Betaproteobacteria bacterium]